MRLCLHSGKSNLFAALAVGVATLLGAPAVAHARTGKLELRASGLALDAHLPDVNENGCKVQLWEYVGRANQQWVLVPVGGGWFRIENRSSGLVLDAHRPDVCENGCKVQLWEYAGARNQQWRLVPQGGGWYTVVNRASGKALDAHRPDANENGCRLQLWDAVPGATNQQWRLVRP
jgi:hypothetical protein